MAALDTAHIPQRKAPGMSTHRLEAGTGRQLCPECGRVLLRLTPPLDGWRFYCRHCERLTLTAAQAAHAEPVTGDTVSVPLSLKILTRYE